MANVRRRTPGFTAPSENEVGDEAQVDALLEEVATEMFETISQTEEEVKPFVEESIIPSEDTGPRFVEVVAEEPPAPRGKASPQPSGQRRHPRNIPKFSRYDKK